MLVVEREETGKKEVSDERDKERGEKSKVVDERKKTRKKKTLSLSHRALCTLSNATL